ncbi:MAG: hypothetical protein WC554_10120 [Clostridia bacterium]|jgi:hypothetical protein
MTWAPSRPLTAAEQRVDWAGHLAHITDRRAAVERGAGPAVKRLALAIADLQSIPKARAAEVSKSLFKALEQTARFGYTEARREIKTMRAKRGEPEPRATLAYAIPDIGEHSEAARKGLAGIEKLLKRRSKYSAWIIAGAIDGAAKVARAAGAEEAIIAEAAITAGAKGLHLHTLELVGETLNLGRTAGALSFETPPEFAMRSEELDKAMCDPCGRAHGTVAVVDSADYYAMLPPAYCLGGGRCRGIVVFEDRAENVRMPEPNPETKPQPKKRAA